MNAFLYYTQKKAFVYTKQNRVFSTYYIVDIVIVASFVFVQPNPSTV